MDPPAAEDPPTACSPRSGIHSPTLEDYEREVEAAGTLVKLTQQRLATHRADQDVVKANLRKEHCIELDQLNERYDLQKATLEEKRAKDIEDIEQKFADSEAQISQKLQQLLDGKSQDLRVLEKMLAAAREGAQRKLRGNRQLHTPEGSVLEASLRPAIFTEPLEGESSKQTRASYQSQRPPATAIPAPARECEASGEDDCPSTTPIREGDRQTTLRVGSEPAQSTAETTRPSPAGQMDGMRHDPQDIKRRRQTEGLPVLDRSTKRSRTSDSTSNAKVSAATPSLSTRSSPRVVRPYKFSRAFLSQCLGGSPQNTLSKVGKSNQPRVYEIGQYVCWSNTWNPRIPSQPGAPGVVFTVGVFDGSDHHIHNPIDRGMKTSSGETDIAVQVPIHTFCKRAVKVYEYVGVYAFEGYKHQLSKAQEAEQIPSDTKREWVRAMTTERGWPKDLLDDAGLKVEAGDFSSFVTKLMNKSDHPPGTAIGFYSGTLTFQGYDDALYAALVEEGRKNGEINENGNIDVGSSVSAPSQRRAPGASNVRHRQSTGRQRDSKRRPSTRARRHDYRTEDQDEDDYDDCDHSDETDPVVTPAMQRSTRASRAGRQAYCTEEEDEDPPM